MSNEQRKREARLAQLAGPLARFGRLPKGDSAREAVAAGAQLCLLKEVVQHGDWLPALERLNIGKAAAQRVMACARRFHHLPDPFFDAVGNASKLQELLGLDASEVNSLAEGAEVYGVTLESLRHMTVVELREALRSGGNPALRRGEPVDEPEPRTLQLVARLQPKPGVEDAHVISRSCHDLDNDCPELSVAEEVLLRHWRQCNLQGRRALSDAACAMAVATLGAQR